jgi:glycosyltransferase involved in cell wall biosynthesis
VTGNLRFWLLIRKWKIQYLILNGASALPYTGLAKLLIRFNLTVWLHTLITSKLQKILLGPLGWMNQRVCVSEFVAQSVSGSATVIPLGVPVPETLAPKAGSDSFKLFSAGRITRGKGYETLIEAVSLLKSRNWTLQIAGKGWSNDDERYLQELKDLTLKLSVSEKVDWLGFVEPKDYLPSQSVCIFPTHLPEAFGLVAVEAMALGCLTVASEVGAIPEIIKTAKPDSCLNPEAPVNLP